MITSFYRFLRFCLYLMTFLILTGLTLTTLTSHAYMALDSNEIIRFKTVPLFFYPLVLCGLLALFFLNKVLKKWSAQHLFWVGALSYLILGSFLIRHVGSDLRADAARTYALASAFNSGDFSDLTTIGSYLYTYPFQLGLVTLNRLYLVFSNDVHLVFFCNLLYVISINGLLGKITQKLINNEQVTKVTLLLSFLFFPHFFFILFAYGTIPGLLASLLGFYLLVRYSEKGRIPYLLAGALCLSLAVLIRSNYQIFALTILVVYGLYALFLKKWKPLLVPIIVFCSLFSANRALASYYSNVIHQPLPQGIPMLSYVTMGVSESYHKNNPGWYTAYNAKSLKRNHFNREVAQKEVRHDLIKRLATFQKSPSLALDFFARKIRSTWTEPTFQSLWTGPLVKRGQSVYGTVLRNLYSGGSLYRHFHLFGGFLLVLIYGFNAFYLLVNLIRPKTDHTPLSFYSYVFFLGAFLFHLIWETKSQYVYIYVLLLIPTAAQGIFLFLGSKPNTQKS